MAKPIFYDPERKRWRRLRRLLDVIVLATSLLIVFFILTVFRGVPLAQLLLPQQRRPYKALKEKERRHPRAQRAARKSKKPASQPAAIIAECHSLPA